jgi:hypothetical protein
VVISAGAMLNDEASFFWSAEGKPQFFPHIQVT